MDEVVKCDDCGSTGHETADCCYCGSSRHLTDRCPIHQKVRLAEMGVPVQHLFDNVVVVNSVEEVVEAIGKIREGHLE